MRSPSLSWLSLSLFLLALIPAIASGQDSASGWTPELAMKVKNVGSVRVSPDGRRVVYTINQAVMSSDKSEFISQIWTANADGSEPLQLTFAEKSSEKTKMDACAEANCKPFIFSCGGLKNIEGNDRVFPVRTAKSSRIVTN